MSEDQWKCLRCGEVFGIRRYVVPGRCPNPNCGEKKCFEAMSGPFKYFVRGKFVAAKLAEEIKQQYRFITNIQTEDIYVYEGGVYTPLGEQRIREKAQELLGDLATIHCVNEVVECVRRETYTPAEFFGSPPLNLVCVENGILNIETGELMPHTPDLVFLSKLPVRYEPEAGCPNIMRFLEEVVPDARDREVLLEYVAYCLYRQYPIHKALMLVGSGSNGKSTFINLVKAFLGKANVASRSLQELCTDRFAMADLYGKLANLFYDLPGAAVVDTGPFKALVGGDMVKGENKFKSAFFFENHAKIVFSANQIPRVSADHSDAFFRRWIIICFPNVFEGRNADRNILKKITSPEELSGLLNLAVGYLKKLLEQGDFSYAKTTDEIRTDYLRRSDPVTAFAQDVLLRDPAWAVEKQALYKGFCEYCRLGKMVAVNPETFFKRLQKCIEYADERIRRENTRISVLVGLKINPEAAECPETAEEPRYTVVFSFSLKASADVQGGQGGQGALLFKNVTKSQNSNNIDIKIRKIPDHLTHFGQDKGFFDLLNRLIERFGFNRPFSPLDYADLFDLEELAKLPALFQRLLDQGLLVETPEGMMLVRGRG